jgi:hypothetical protein
MRLRPSEGQGENRDALQDRSETTMVANTITNPWLCNWPESGVSGIRNYSPKVTLQA